MREELETRLKGPVNFPSPPVIAQKIIEQAQDPDADVSRIAETIAKDPGLTAKILRTANSPLYAQRRRSQNLRQAVLVLGLNATTTLALSFSIVTSLKKNTPSRGLNYPLYWKRTLLAAIAARTLAEVMRLPNAEDLFLAALLQDLGVLALDRARPGFYADLPANATTAQLLNYERDKAGEDHAAIGAWLLQTWNLPELLWRAVATSHKPEQASADTAAGRFARCVAFAGELAEMFVSPQRAETLNRLAPRALKLLDVRRQQLGDVMGQIARLAPETEQLFEMNILDSDDAAALMDQAREIMATRSLQSLSELDALRQATHSLVARTEALEDASRHDGLTGLCNRAYLDRRLHEEFEAATSNGWPLTVAFVDLDDFKKVNDTYGHLAGDKVLKTTAQLLSSAVRETDVVARYGGEEFVIVFPGMDQASAQSVCERIVAVLRRTQHAIAEHSATVTASIGIATFSKQSPHTNVAQLVHAADSAVYAAKRGGRDRIEASPLIAAA